MTFRDPRFDEDDDAGTGRLAVVVVPRRDGPSTLLVIEQGDFSVGCPLTSGQLHRLTNALGGRGTRSGIRPLSLDEEHVYLGGSPELLVVEVGDREVHVPAGPKRALYKALRTYEKEPPLR